MGTIVLLWCGKRNKKTPPDWVVLGADEGTCPPAGGAVARKNSPPDCFLTRALQFPSSVSVEKIKAPPDWVVLGADEGT